MNDAVIKLKDPIPDFKYFAEDQILTAGDLNRVINFMDRQHRMTRSYTLGVGIVCGLEASLMPFSRIALSKGVAITTDGDLPVIENDTVYTHFKKYLDEDAKYKQFLNNNGDTIPMWELSTAAADGRKPLTQFANGNNPDFSGLVVVLYLESFIEAEEDCEGQDCNKRGDRQVRNLKVLLVRQADIAATTKPLAKAALALPKLTAARVNLVSNRITSYIGSQGLAASYVKAINSTRDTVRRAFGELGNSVFQSMLKNVLDNKTGWQQLLDQARFKPGNDSRRIQYVYSFFQDLVNAYNEWRECACQLPGGCLPDPELFPKHIVVGELDINVGTTERTRHYFRKSALLTSGDEASARCYFLLRRIDVLIRCFRPSRVTKIRITPSKSQCHALSARAIPYYFPDLGNTPNPRNIWSFEARQAGTLGHIHSYHANEDAEAAEEAKSWSAFDISKYEFLRIEGHFGQTIDSVENKLERLAKIHNLPFHVISLQVDDIFDRVRLPPKLRFPDLDAMFRLQKIDVVNAVRAASDFGSYAGARIEDVGDHDLKAEAKTHINSFNMEMTNTVKFIPRKLSDFNQLNAKKFKSSLEKSFKAAEHFERVSSDIFRPTKASPIQEFLNARRFRDFGLLLELYDQRKKKVQEKSIFANFFADHPGIQHLGGVWSGGTLILIYEADSREVLADFCLPYQVCCDLATLEPEDLDEPVEPVGPMPPIPIPRPPIFIKPPYIFNPDPWWVVNKYRIDTWRGDVIRNEFDKTRTDFDKKVDIRFGKAFVDSQKDIADRFDQAKLMFGNDITHKFNSRQTEIDGAIHDFDKEIKDRFTEKIKQASLELDKTITQRFDDRKSEFDGVIHNFNQSIETLMTNRINKVSQDLKKTITQRFDDRKTEFEGVTRKFDQEIETRITSKIDEVSSKLESEIPKQIMQNQAWVETTVNSGIERSQQIFETYVDSKIVASKWVGGHGRAELDIGVLMGGASVAVEPKLLKIIEDINVTRNSRNKLQTKKSLGANLTLEEEAALSKADARLADLVIDATTQPALSGRTLDTTSRALVETLRHVSLGIENTSSRKKLVSHFGTLNRTNSTAKELNKIVPVLNRR